MRSDDIAALMVAGMQSQVTGNTDIGYHLGTVLSWDDTTGLNSVQINGATFNNLRVITAGPGISIATGDTIVVLRYQTSYFIMGKVAAPGAGAAIRSVSAYVDPGGGTASATYVDLATAGPSVTTYIGPSGKALVFLSTYCNSAAGITGWMSFALSGANTAAASDIRAAHQWAQSSNLLTTMSRIVQVEGLLQGGTTFTAKYRKDGTGADPGFANRSLVVIPF